MEKLCTNKNRSYKHNEQINKQNVDNSECFGVKFVKIYQGFQSGPVRGTFTRLRSCIGPAEITEPPKISGGQNHKYDRLVEYFS